MSVRGNKLIGIPTVLLHEGEGLTLTVETQSGFIYRGVCATTEDNMNVSLKDVTATDPHGIVTKLERVFIRGSQVLLIIFPEAFAKAPFFTRVALASQGVAFAGGLGRGRQAAIGARGEKMLLQLRLPRIFECAFPMYWMTHSHDPALTPTSRVSLAVASKQADMMRGGPPRGPPFSGPPGPFGGPPPGFGGPPPGFGGHFGGPPPGFGGPPPGFGGPPPGHFHGQQGFQGGGPGGGGMGRGDNRTRPAWQH